MGDFEHKLEMVSRYLEDKMRFEMDSLKVSQDTYKEIGPNRNHNPLAS